MTAKMQKLKGKIAESGYTQGEFSRKLGISASTLIRKFKANGCTFTIYEVHRIANILELSQNEIAQIFLVEQSHYCDITNCSDVREGEPT